MPLAIQLDGYAELRGDAHFTAHGFKRLPEFKLVQSVTICWGHIERSKPKIKCLMQKARPLTTERKPVDSANTEDETVTIHGEPSTLSTVDASCENPPQCFTRRKRSSRQQ